MKEADPEEALRVDLAAVEDQRKEQRQDQHHRTCMTPNLRSVMTPAQNLGATNALAKLSVPTTASHPPASSCRGLRLSAFSSGMIRKAMNSRTNGSRKR